MEVDQPGHEVSAPEVDLLIPRGDVPHGADVLDLLPLGEQAQTLPRGHVPTPIQEFPVEKRVIHRLVSSFPGEPGLFTPYYNKFLKKCKKNRSRAGSGALQVVWGT